MKTSTTWKKGQSGNPKGRTPRLQGLRDALEEERDPAKFKAMLCALYERGFAGDNFAAKIWLEYVCPTRQQGLPDLSQAPDEVVRWLATEAPEARN